MRKTREQRKVKFCPFLEQDCLKSDCEIYNDILDRCNIDVIPYNMYKLTEAKIVNSITKSSQFGKKQTPVFFSAGKRRQ